MGRYLLGIDIGTSSCKVAVFSTKGEVIGSESENYPVYYPQKGWAEQDPNEWWEAVCRATKRMLEKINLLPEEIAGIGIDGQSWSAIPMNQEGQVLCNTPIWMDTRAKAICDELKEKIDEQEIFNLCGNKLQPAYTLPKILWYKKHLPEMYAQIYKVLQSNSFIAYKLTGSMTQDVSQGYGLQCFNARTGSWDLEMCEKLGIEISMLPDIYPCHEVIGYVTEEASQIAGLAQGTPVVAGGLDAACGTLGAGVIDGGQTQEQGGQAGGMSICMDTYSSEQSLILGCHVIPHKWLLQGGTVGGGGVIKWVQQEFCKELNFTQMSDLAEPIAIGSEGLVFLPYMAGERSPIWDTYAKGTYFGFDFSKTRAHMIRSSFEGVAYALQHNLEIAEKAGVKVDRLYAMGGAANSSVWTQIKADVIGKEICVPASDTATTLGAALLAGVGVGLYKDFEEAVSETVKVKKVYQPNPENHKIYEHYYEIYRELYEKLKDTMKKL